MLAMALVAYDIYIWHTDEALVVKSRTCIVIDKMILYSKQTQLTLILRAENGRCFDLSVTPTAYAMAKINEPINFDLSDKFMTGDDPNDRFYSMMLFGIVTLVIIAIVAFTSSQSDAI